MKLCPCCSGKEYASCCKIYHDGALPPTALALMRSRYSAYALGKAAYILDTTHPKSIYFEQDKKKWEQAVLKFSKGTKFLKLEILGSGEDWVHFAAHLEESGVAFTLKEKSHFQKVDGKWLYLSGEVSTEARTSRRET